MTPDERIKLYKEALAELRLEHEAIAKELEIMKTREYLLRKTIEYLDQLTRPPDKVTFHLLTREESIQRERNKKCFKQDTQLEGQRRKQ